MEIDPLLQQVKLRRTALFWGGFWLWENSDWFCLGDDTVLLADFAQPAGGDRLLDLGTGSGALPLLLLAKAPTLRIQALELMAPLVALARYNMAVNGVTVAVSQGDMARAGDYFDAASFDYIVTNPPYRKRGTGRSSPHPLRRAAREEVYVELAALLAAAAPLLRREGRLAIIYPYQREAELCQQASANDLWPRRRRLVHAKENRVPCRVLLEFQRGIRGQTAELAPFILYDDHGTPSETLRSLRRRNDDGKR